MGGAEDAARVGEGVGGMPDMRRDRDLREKSILPLPAEFFQVQVISLVKISCQDENNSKFYYIQIYSSCRSTKCHVEKDN